MAESINSKSASRRALLTGLPAAAIGVGALLVPAGAAGASNPDAKLLSMAPEFDAMIAKWEAAVLAHSLAEAAYNAERPAKPVFDQELHHSLKGDAQREHQKNWSKRIRAFNSECARLNAKHNVDGLERISDELGDEVTNRIGDLVEIQAKTLQGLKFKARISEYDDELAETVIEDLLAL